MSESTVVVQAVHPLMIEIHKKRCGRSRACIIQVLSCASLNLLNMSLQHWCQRFGAPEQNIRMAERAMAAHLRELEKTHRTHIYVSMLIWQLDDVFDSLQDQSLLTPDRRRMFDHFRFNLEQILGDLDVRCERVKYRLKQMLFGL